MGKPTSERSEPPSSSMKRDREGDLPQGETRRARRPASRRALSQARVRFPVDFGAFPPPAFGSQSVHEPMDCFPGRPCLFPQPAAFRGGLDVYFGTYTSADGSKGIYRASLDPETDRLTEPVLAAELPSPSFSHDRCRGKTPLRRLRSRRTGWGAGHRLPHRRHGRTRTHESAAQRRKRSLSHLPRPDGATLLVANYGGGSVASYRVGKRIDLRAGPA